MTTCSCGLDSHMDQVRNYPVGTKVALKIDTGGTCKIVGHCEDGRALVEYPNRHIHTFHDLDSYVERIELPPPTVEALQAEIARLKADVKATQDLILFLPLPDEPDRYRALTQLRTECYRVAKLIRTE